jgi:hypothetical protein
MSKARTKARRQQKRQRTAGPANSQWLWGVAVGLPILLIGALLLWHRGGGAQAVDAPATTPATAPLTATVALNVDPPPTTAPAARPIGAADYCRRHPRFARTLGFNEQAYLMTSSPQAMGLVLIQPAAGDTPERVYQDPTWDDAGYLGPMSFDRDGNVYTFPSPRVSLLDNPPEEQNTLYLVDSDSAQMTALITLTAATLPSTANPFGIMGTTYDCDTNSLYVSTVAGSTAAAETGKVVRIDLATTTVAAEMQGIDPFGLSVHNEVTADGAVAKQLYFGAARAAEVYGVALGDDGSFAGQPTLALTLPDPALKPWRIVWDSNGDLIVRAMPFDFNLLATSERVEVPFRYRQDDTGSWQLIAE